MGDATSSLYRAATFGWFGHFGPKKAKHEPVPTEEGGRAMYQDTRGAVFNPAASTDIQACTVHICNLEFVFPSLTTSALI